MKLMTLMVLFLITLSSCTLARREVSNTSTPTAAASPQPTSVPNSSATPVPVPASDTGSSTTRQSQRTDAEQVQTPSPSRHPSTEKNVKYKTKTKYDFEDDTIEGDLTRPNGNASAPAASAGVRTLTSPDQKSAANAPARPTTISGGVLNGRATKLVQPPYPAIARAAHVSGTVNVQVTIDEDGNVISAHALSGHPLLKPAAVAAARASKFSPTIISGQHVKVTGVIVYNFVER